MESNKTDKGRVNCLKNYLKEKRESNLFPIDDHSLKALGFKDKDELICFMIDRLQATDSVCTELCAKVQELEKQLAKD